MKILTQPKPQVIAEKTGIHSAVVYMPASAGLEATARTISWLVSKGCSINFVAATARMSAIRCRQAVTKTQREFEKGAGTELANAIYIRGPQALMTWLENYRGAWCIPESLSLKTEKTIAQNADTWLLQRQLDRMFPEVEPLGGASVTEIDNYYCVDIVLTC